MEFDKFLAEHRSPTAFHNHKRMAVSASRRAQDHKIGTKSYHSAMQMHHIHMMNQEQIAGNHSEATKHAGQVEHHGKEWRKAK